MGKEESFLLVSLEESKAKKLAQVISNDTSRKILDLLAKKDATETEISKELEVPISTVHYNLKSLVDAKLVNIDEFHYSKKGKEINHYSLANKLIIIAPRETKGLKEALRKFLPISILSVGGAALIYLTEIFGKGAQSVYSFAAPRMAADSAIAPMAIEAESKALEIATQASGGALDVAADEAVNTATEQAVGAVAPTATQLVTETVVQNTQSLPLAMWFLFGALFVIILFVLFEVIASKRKS